MSVVNLAIAIGLGALVAMWLVYAVLSQHWNPLKLVEGADRKLSTSKFQWWVWVWATAFAYITIYAARSLAQGGMATPITDIPENVLLVLGFSTGTATIAKGITQSYAASGLVTKEKPDKAVTDPKDLVAADSGVPDLYKLQIFIWTLIAVGIYVATLFSIVSGAAAAADRQAALAALRFPDIDSSLMLLSGLSATGYLGKKVVTRDAPKLASVTPSEAPAGQALDIVILGSNFGPEQKDSMLNIGPRVNYPAASWTDTQVRATVPQTFPKGIHEVSLIVHGVKTNVLTLKLS